MEVSIYIGTIEIEFIYFFCTKKENDVTQGKRAMFLMQLVYHSKMRLLFTFHPWKARGL